MKKPKLIKLPKKPKQSASVDQVERFLVRKKEVEKENKTRLAKFLKVKKALEKV